MDKTEQQDQDIDTSSTGEHAQGITVPTNDQPVIEQSKTTPTPHDLTFKQFLHHPTTARDFMQLHLPVWIQDICDFSTLKLESGSFVDDDLRPYFSDILYSLQTTTGKPGYACILIEHQSTPDPHMAFRLLRYAVAAMQRHLNHGHKTLPLVIPVLFYAGKRSPYPFTTRWLDEFDDPTLAKRLYTGAFPLVDVTVIPDEEILTHRSMSALTLLQKHIHCRDLMAIIDKLGWVLNHTLLTGQQLVSLINYFAQSGQATDAETFVRNLAHYVPQHKDTLMTIAEQLEQKGMEKGIQKGIEQGRLIIARTMLQNGMDKALVLKMTGLTDDELSRIDL